MDMENKRTEDVIGEVVIRYQGDFGTLALNINLDLDISEAEMEQLQNLVTGINEIIIPAINKKMIDK